MKALVVLSGGQDSSTCAFWAKQQPNLTELHAITFDYGQSHVLEIKSAMAIGVLAGVKSHRLCMVGPVLKSTSPLTNPQQPLETYNTYDEMDKIIGDRVEKTFVPMRNALFLTLAANHAVSLGCDTLITGVCQADNANYPDCRQSFIDAMQHMINEALGMRCLTISTPLMDLSKARSIVLARAVDGYYALAFTHTAYDGQYPPIGNDHASTLRRHGFEEAGVPDPLVIRAVNEGLMPLPQTLNYMDRHANRLIVDEIHKLKDYLFQHRVRSQEAAEGEQE